MQGLILQQLNFESACYSGWEKCQVLQDRRLGFFLSISRFVFIGYDFISESIIDLRLCLKKFLRTERVLGEEWFRLQLSYLL